jgi:hypothetical protein
MKLSREMERALGELAHPRLGTREWTVNEFARETYVGATTLRALLKRGLVELVYPSKQADAQSDRAAVAVFTIIRLTEAAKPIAEVAWRERNKRLAESMERFQNKLAKEKKR